MLGETSPRRMTSHSHAKVAPILDGLRIVELSAFIAAPLCGLTLAQLGAEVVRVDLPGGNMDFNRLPLAPSGRSLYWASLNRGKRSIEIDFRRPEGKRLIADLVSKSGPDGGILVTNLPLDGALSYDVLRQARDDLIMVRLSGSPDGKSEMDYTVNCAVGFPMMTGHPGHIPTNHVLPAWDAMAGLTLANAVLAAERHRQRTGQGQLIDLALSDIAMATCSNLGYISETEVNGVDRKPDGNHLYGAYGDAFATADGRYVMVVAISDRQWRALVEALGVEESLCEAALARRHRLDSEGARYAARGVISEHFRPWFRQRTLVEVEEVLGKHPVLWGVYRTMSQMLAEDPRCSERNPMFRRLDHPGVGSFLTSSSPLSFGVRALVALVGAGARRGHRSRASGVARSVEGRYRANDGRGYRWPQARMSSSNVDLLASCRQAQDACESLFETILSSFRHSAAASDSTEPGGPHRHQATAHGLAWFATYVRGLHEMLTWAGRLEVDGRLGETEQLMLRAAYAEYLAQLIGGIAMSQCENFRASGVDAHAVDAFCREPSVQALRDRGFTAVDRSRLAALLARGLNARDFGNPAFDDPMLTEVQAQFASYADNHAAAAHEWHPRDDLIPDSVISELGALGVFGMTIPEEFGGTGMGKTAMCVLTEELSRGYIGLGSLGTRSEIAAELIRAAGTDAQRRKFLPLIAAGTLLPTAAFTEPDVGSDLGSVTTRAERRGDQYFITGAKTWMTHGSRSDLMTLLVRTDTRVRGYGGLSILLVEKPRGGDRDPFPMNGMSGSEIPVLGYRGMKEFEVAFDGCAVPASSLLGQSEGDGFRQLMRTFETARIQTGARAVGVAQCAFELGLRYACERKQFGEIILPSRGSATKSHGWRSKP